MGNLYSQVVAIPLVEYEELLRESEKMECIKRFYGASRNRTSF